MTLKKTTELVTKISQKLNFTLFYFTNFNKGRQLMIFSASRSLKYPENEWSMLYLSLWDSRNLFSIPKIGLRFFNPQGTVVIFNTALNLKGTIIQFLIIVNSQHTILI